MTTNEHIAAIKEHLKAIEEEKQPKKEPKRYLIVATQHQDLFSLLRDIWESAYDRIDTNFIENGCYPTPNQKLTAKCDEFKRFILSGKIITINEE